MPELTTVQRWNYRLLARTGTVLKLLNSLGRPAGSTEIAAALGMSTPTIRRYLRDLEALRFVRRLPESRLYAACTDFEALLAGPLDPEPAPEAAAVVEAALEEPAAPSAALPIQEAAPADGIPSRAAVQKDLQAVGKNFFPHNPAVAVVKYFNHLERGLTATTAPPAGKIFPHARAPDEPAAPFRPPAAVQRAHALPGRRR